MFLDALVLGSQSQQREDLSPAGLGVDQELSLSAFDLLAPS
jgi:hypothetical protein